MRRRYSSRFGPQRRRRGLAFPLFILLVIVGGIAWYLFFETEKPLASLNVNSKYLGTNSTIAIEVEDNRSGVRSVELKAVQQGGKEQVLYRKEYPRNGYKNPVGPREHKVKVQVNSSRLGFREGPVTLQLTTRDFSLNGWLQGNSSTITREMIVDTEAPKIQLLSVDSTISPGGSGIAVYKVNDTKSSSGVRLNDNFFRGWPVTPDSKDTFIAYFALPCDAVDIHEMSIRTTDLAGNTSQVPFYTKFKAVRKKHDTITIADSFLHTKIPEFEQYYPDIEGSFIDKFIYINNTVRKENNQKIKEICSNPLADRTWKGAFLRMHGATRANFADYRTYTYKGKVIDHQVHLGVDIASLRQDKVRAANTGKVKWTGYLGIYGSMIILDHGQGVYSLYSHLSKTDVKVGDTVQKGMIIGRTGKSGMAGGDHLHFSMLINGIFVTPHEWWDKRWIRNNIDGPLSDFRFLQTGSR